MPNYEVYLVGPQGRGPSPATVIVCANDQALVSELQTFTSPTLNQVLASAGFTLEAWEGSRRVFSSFRPMPS